MTNMGLKNRDGLDIKDYWSNGIRAYLGTTFAGYPNAFMSYTPYAPTALSNGTTMIETQCDFACAAIRKVLDSEKNGGRKIKSIEALSSAEDEWAAYVNAQNEPTLYPLTESWWTGANIPGKKPQMLTYLLGISEYEKEITGKLERLEGFDVRYWSGEREFNNPVVANASRQSDDSKASADHVEHVEHVEYVQPGLTRLSEAAEVLRPIATAD